MNNRYVQNKLKENKKEILSLYETIVSDIHIDKNAIGYGMNTDFTTNKNEVYTYETFQTALKELKDIITKEYKPSFYFTDNYEITHKPFEDVFYNVLYLRNKEEVLDALEEFKNFNKFHEDLNRLEWLTFDNVIRIMSLQDNKFTIKGDIVITDPCYVKYDKTQFHYERDTIYGDWSCTTVDENNNILGYFCADSGMVGVYLLDYISNKNILFEKPHLATIIKNFDGDINFKISKQEEEYYLNIIGKGNVNFKTFQSGF